MDYMKKEQTDMEVVFKVDIPNDVREIKGEVDVLEDVKDLEFIFKSVDCLADMKDQGKQPQREDGKDNIEAKIAEAWRLLEETSYLSDTEYNAPSSLRQDRQPNVVYADEINNIPSKDSEDEQLLSTTHMASRSSIRCSSPENQKFIYPVCGKSSRSSFLHMEHKKLHENKCHTCGKNFVTKNFLKIHMRIHALGAPMTAVSNELPEKADRALNLSKINTASRKQSKKTLVQKSETEKDIEEIKKREYFKDRARGAQLNVNSSTTERQAIEKGKNFVCNYCMKSFALRAKLVEHIRVHTGEMPFACNICGKRLRYRECLKNHQHIHSGTKPFGCGECGKGFIQRCNLKTHLSTHTGERPFKCETCGKHFSTNGNLNRHSQTHTGDKTYFTCPVCLKGISPKSYLSDHLRIHTGERPFKCNVCGKTFSCSSNLNTHYHCHTDERPFVCSSCGKGFKSKPALKQHVLIHLQEWPHFCDICKRSFRFKSQLQNHVKAKHI